MAQVASLAELNAATATEVTYDPVKLAGTGLFIPRSGVHYHSTQPGARATLTGSIYLSDTIGAMIEDLAVANPSDSALGSDKAKPSHDLECSNLDLSGWAPVQLNARDYNITLRACDIHDAANNGVVLLRYADDQHVRAPQPGGFGFKMLGGSIRRTGLSPDPSAGPVHGAYINWFDSVMDGVVVEDWAHSGITWRYGGGHIGWCDFRAAPRSIWSISYFEYDPVPGTTTIEACRGYVPSKPIYLDQFPDANEEIDVLNCSGLTVDINANNEGKASWDGELAYPRAGTAYWPGAPQPPVDVPSARANILMTVNWFHTSKRQGGMGYDVARTKKTAAYRALVNLGGVWP